MTYHYHAIYQKIVGQVIHIDGIIKREKPIETYDEYHQLKREIAWGDADADKLTICSLTVIDR